MRGERAVPEHVLERIRFANGLAEPTIVHWHGLDMPSAMDGHPHSAIDPQREFVYEFEVMNRAGTYWYHPHPHSRTGPQVYRGLAGLVLIDDDEERALNLPGGLDELACVLQDRRFDGRNQLTYVPGGMMEQAQGFLGDRVLVNGRERPSWALATRAYRLRLLNGSNARIYKLAWSDGARSALSDGFVDAGWLDTVLVMPGETVRIKIPFTHHPGLFLYHCHILEHEDMGMMRELPLYN